MNKKALCDVLKQWPLITSQHFILNHIYSDGELNQQCLFSSTTAELSFCLKIRGFDCRIHMHGSKEYFKIYYDAACLCAAIKYIKLGR